MKFKPELVDYQGEKIYAKDAYEKWKLVNLTDPYGRRIFSFAEDWANAMEKCLEKNQSVAQCAKDCASYADYDGITGFMYNAAVQILSMAWFCGEDLRKWHNNDIDPVQAESLNKDEENKPVLNSSILTIYTDE